MGAVPPHGPRSARPPLPAAAINFACSVSNGTRPNTRPACAPRLRQRQVMAPIPRRRNPAPCSPPSNAHAPSAPSALPLLQQHPDRRTTAHTGEPSARTLARRRCARDAVMPVPRRRCTIAAMTPKKRKQLCERFKAANPKPTTELRYSTHFELQIAVILSAQATDKGVNKATEKLFKVANTPAALLLLGEAGLKEYGKTINLYITKAKNIITSCRMLLEQHHCEVPNNRAALEALAGVGRKTANVILNTAFGGPTIADDAHIF